MKSIFYISLFVVLVMGLNSCSKETIVSKNLILGDSRVANYPLKEFFLEVSLDKDGRKGSRTTEIFQMLLSNNYFEYDKIFISVGINDLLQDNKTDLVREIESLFKELKIKNKELYDKISFISIIPCTREINDQINFFSVNKELEVSLIKLEIPFIDLGDSLSDSSGFLKSRLTTDGIHLNLNAYKILTENLVRWLRD